MGLIDLVLLICKSAIFFIFILFSFFCKIQSHFFKIVIIPVLDGFIFTFLINIFELFVRAVRTIKALELISVEYYTLRA